MADIPNGRAEVYEVYQRSTEPCQEFLTEDGMMPYYPPSTQVATFWDREEAGAFLRALTGSELRSEEVETTFLVGGSSGQQRRSVVVVDGNVHYDLNEDPVPASLIYEAAAEAARVHLSTHPEVGAVRPQLQALAATAFSGAEV